MVDIFSWFRSRPKSDPSDAASTPPLQPTSTTLTPPEAQVSQQQQQQPPQNKTKTDADDLPKLWTPQTNTKLFFGGALFFALSLLTTRRALNRRFKASIPPFYTTSVYHKPEVNGGMEAFEALHLATVNVLSFGMMASGGVLWAMGINGIEDMRAYVKKSMAQGDRESSKTDEEMEKEVEAWVMRYLGKKIEGGKLKDLNDTPGAEGEKST